MYWVISLGDRDAAAGALSAPFLVHYDYAIIFSFGYGFCRALPQADTASLTLVRQDIESYQSFARQSRTSLFTDMGFILITEVIDGSEHRIGTGLS